MCDEQRKYVRKLISGTIDLKRKHILLPECENTRRCTGVYDMTLRVSRDCTDKAGIALCSSFVGVADSVTGRFWMHLVSSVASYVLTACSLLLKISITAGMSLMTLRRERGRII